MGSPVTKFKNRVHEINKSGSASRQAISTYNQRAVSVLGYLAQLRAPPKNLRQIELAGVHKILLLATHSMSYQALLYCRNTFGMRFVPLNPYCAASCIKAATRTVVRVDEVYSELRVAADNGLPLASWSRDLLNPLGWDSPPIECNLYRAKHLEDYNIYEHHLLQGCPWANPLCNLQLFAIYVSSFLATSSNSWPRGVECCVLLRFATSLWPPRL